MRSWKNSMWYDWTIKFPILCELKMEMEYKIIKIKSAFHDLEKSNNIVEGSELKFPDFLCEDKIRVLQPDNAQTVFATKLAKLDHYLHPQFKQPAATLEDYFQEYQLQETLHQEQRKLMLENNSLDENKALLIAGFKILENNTLLEQEIAKQQLALNSNDQKNNMRHVFASGDEFIDRLMQGKFVKHPYNPQRIHYFLLMNKMRGLLTRGRALRATNSSDLARDTHINSTIYKILERCDAAGQNSKKRLAVRY